MISARGEQRVRAGHPWIYRTDVVDVSATSGEIVEVIGPRHRKIGNALFSDRSQISIRMLTVGDVSADEALLNNGGIVSQCRHARTRRSPGDNVGHIPRLVKIRRDLIARTRAVDGDSARLFGEHPFHRVDALPYGNDLPNLWIAD